MTSNLADIITCAKLQDGIFMRYNFTRVEFPIFLLIFAWALQQCSANALPVIMSLSCAMLLFGLMPLSCAMLPSGLRPSANISQLRCIIFQC